MKNGISIIIPCYNVEQYISKCLDSIINQNIKEYEIILVDDCSTDNTVNVIEGYIDNNTNIDITLIKNKNNSGAGFSRNQAVKIAKYDIISFIDSDDYIDNNFYESMLNRMISQNADITVCDIVVKFDTVDGLSERKSACEDENDKYSFINNGLAASPCNKLFKKEYLLKYPFMEGIMNEDIACVIPILADAKKIAYANDACYYYIQRKNSVQNENFSDKKFDIFTSVSEALNRVKDNEMYSKIKDALVYNQFLALLLYVIPKEKNRKKRKNILKKFGKLSRNYDILSNNNLFDFLEKCGKKHRVYYKTLVNLTCHNHYILANNLISMYDFLYKVLKKSVIKENIDLDKVVEMAKKHSSLKNEEIKVSVIIPNYNYARFMYQRIYSILSQKHKIYELIILDDKSKDNSIEVIDEIVEKIKPYINVKIIYNTENSGSAFKQWKKGFDNASGDYVWIAEADDYCEDNFLNSIISPIKKNKNIVISYCDTAFIDTTGFITLKSIKPEIDIQKSGHWNKSFINRGLDEINNYSFLNCTIANVSSCIIKKQNYDTILSDAGTYKQAGDWLFYVEVMAQGDISYINKALNYYRLHGNNVSSVMNHQKHLDEINRLYEYYNVKYNLDIIHKQKMQERINFLKKVWKLK